MVGQYIDLEVADRTLTLAKVSTVPAVTCNMTASDTMMSHSLITLGELLRNYAGVDCYLVDLVAVVV